MVLDFIDCCILLGSYLLWWYYSGRKLNNNGGTAGFMEITHQYSLVGRQKLVKEETIFITIFLYKWFLSPQKSSWRQNETDSVEDSTSVNLLLANSVSYSSRIEEDIEFLCHRLAALKLEDL